MSSDSYNLTNLGKQAADVLPPPPPRTEYEDSDSSEDDMNGNRPAKRPRNFIARQVSLGPYVAFSCVLTCSIRHVKHAELEKLDATKRRHVACAKARGFGASTWKESLLGQSALGID
jgi:hypothetical protein